MRIRNHLPLNLRIVIYSNHCLIEVLSRNLPEELNENMEILT
jgi:hypothetical protein